MGVLCSVLHKEDGVHMTPFLHVCNCCLLFRRCIEWVLRMVILKVMWRYGENEMGVLI